MADPRVAAGHRWISPEDEFVHTVENNGAGVSLPVIAKRWGVNYDALKEKARGVPDGDGFKPRTSWREKRSVYLEKLTQAREERQITRMADEQARIERDYAEMARAEATRIRAELARRQKENTPLVVKTDKELMELLDKTNKIERRNRGLPETSHEVRGRAEFVRDVIGRFVGMLQRHVRDPDAIKQIAYELTGFEDEVAREEGDVRALSAG